jgi:carbon-monoxide dehydrogenase medium subunit
MKMRLSKPAYVVDIGRLPGLDRITEEENHVILGALVTHAQIEDSDLLKSKCPLLPQTATTIADVQVRNCGTIGGSIAHADPAGDWPAAVMALDAEIQIFGPNGERWVKCDEFFLGLLMSVIEPDEIVTAVKVPVTGTDKTAYLKAAPRSSGFAVVASRFALRWITRERAAELQSELPASPTRLIARGGSNKCSPEDGSTQRSSRRQRLKLAGTSNPLKTSTDRRNIASN